MTRPRFLPDNYVLALAGMVVLASFLPVRGQLAQAFDGVTAVAVGLLFFLHGAKLSRESIVAGITHWRLHLAVLASTFLLIPLLGIALGPLLTRLVGPDLYLGILFLCVLPSTVQSSIALTSVARGNVPAAVCSASASNFLGIFLTPVLAGLVLSLHGEGQSSLDSVFKIVVQLLLPFVAGHLARRWIGAWVARRKSLLKYVDQGSILLVVYTAFSEAVVQGLWQQLPAGALAGLLVANALLLGLAIGITTWVSRRLGFSREDEVVMVFCGSKKSLASGVPIAKVLFAGNVVGVMVLPLMLFHQMQLMLCAVLANRYARRAAAAEAKAQIAADPALPAK
ncbi:bile acid:sodium symporter family protein [Janthinobacterium sp. 17J80-10]|uniref:bile acid:sodium symporter family protein n=1 Tax=Janthinobacterium sp. 17J80-10 TaxID=2497863 RepID=UPI0010058C11|nr:bile acid:sodium symporter family protein [Janthinobacterium sp. 17J80-10]QAU36016.1 bile acid:sodium symporter [Janthinobacterium sp. 17J80-10]